MSHTDGDPAEERLAAIEERMAALEARLAPTAPDRLWALNGLRERLAELPGAATGTGMRPAERSGAEGTSAGSEAPDPSGEIIYAGRAVFAGAPYEWQYGHAVADLSDPAPEQVERPAAALAALGSPVRLRLLLEVLRGTHATADLVALDGVGTSGQVYHHLGRLVDAGWLRHRRRGQMEVPAERVVPLLVALAATR